MNDQPPVKKDKLTRLESSIAEVLRVCYPNQSDSGLVWIDIVEALMEMFSIDKPNFDSERFYSYCFGERPELEL